MRLVKAPAANEPLYIQREAVFKLLDLSKLQAAVIKLKLTQNIGKQHLVVYASQFEPKPGDKLSYTPKDRETGQKLEIPMPHFCLTSYDKVHANILEYINLSKNDYLHRLFSESGDLTWQIVQMAMKYAETRKVNRPPQSTRVPPY